MAWDPSDLSPTAWYDVDLGGSSTQITDSSGNAVAALTFAAGSNSPLWLDAGLGSRLYLPGQQVSGGENVVRQTTSTLPRNASELDVRVAVTFADYTPASSIVLAHHGTSTTAATQTFLFLLLSTGRLRLVTSDGTTTTTTDSATSGGAAAAITLTDGTVGCLRATWRASDGRIQFWQRAPASEADAFGDMQSDTGWTQVGADRTGATVNLHNGSTGVGVLSYGSGSAPTANASLWGFELSTTIDGTPGLTFKPADCGQTGYTSEAAWTLTRASSGRKITVVTPAGNSTRDVMLTGVDDYADGPSAAVPAATSSDSCTLAAVIRPFATMAAGNCILTTRASATAAGVRLEMAGTSSVRAVVSDGTTDVTTASVNLTLGQRNLVGVILDSSGTARAFVANASGTTLGATSSRPSGSQTGGDLRTGHDQALSAGSDLDAESECPYVAYPTAVSSADLQRIFDYYDNDARAQTAAATAEAHQPATNASSGAGTAAATADAQQAGTSVTAPAEIAATVTAAAFDATGNVSVYPDTASVVATANGAGTDATTTAPTAEATATAADGMGGVAALPDAATVTAVASAPGADVASTAGLATVDAVAYDATAGSDVFVFAECATVTVTAHGAGSSAASTAEAATVTATANAAGSSATTVVDVVAAVVALAFGVQADNVVTAAIRATFRESTRGTFHEATRATFRETRQT